MIHFIEQQFWLYADKLNYSRVAFIVRKLVRLCKISSSYVKKYPNPKIAFAIFISTIYSFSNDWFHEWI